MESVPFEEFDIFRSCGCIMNRGKTITESLPHGCLEEEFHLIIGPFGNWHERHSIVNKYTSRFSFGVTNNQTTLHRTRRRQLSNEV